ncbi:helicase [Tsukamurella tyrosinosolvens]|uniref:helicase-related protein n=1 Tax=Tsukamurella tyrosinosolvens TaxID=57704 RepID=UPI0009EEC963|nr:helicase-related protein [Tsukamurella tyrosinosolvens]MCA4993948.1 helicase [Tsukamurella tyrosinosolvens]
MNLTPWYEARDTINAHLSAELYGPSGDPEPLNEYPLNRFLVGVLHPVPGVHETADYVQGMAEDGADEATATADGAEFDAPVALSLGRKPSSVGMTFAVRPVANGTVRILIAANRYVEDAEGGWLPVPIDAEIEVAVDGSVTRRDVHDFDDKRLQLVCLARAAVDGLVRVTVSMVNRQAVPAGEKSDAYCWFQPSIAATTDVEFVDRRPAKAIVPDFDTDARSTAYLYRGSQNIAVGHGCAVDWSEEVPVTEVRTTFIPRHDVLLSDPEGGHDDDPYGQYELWMDQFTGDADLSNLDALADAYERWITARREDLRRNGEESGTGSEHLEKADQCLARIRSGIALLSDDAVARRAFALANAAMIAQRDSQDRARGNQPIRQRWRPFQIAFILMNLPGITVPGHSDRDVADVLWFPTGGGKTEAYLGCIAYSILLRRLRRSDDGGVSAIMRYTLRLLTRQQYERAAGLICALEWIRRRELPECSEISLGLWVGKSASPNTLDEAAAALNAIRDGQRGKTDTNPIQLLRCPWCGKDLGVEHYRVTSHLVIACGETTCAFGDGLPLYLVDDDIYNRRPSLLIGTVDKFALLSWKGEAGNIFSVDNEFSKPDLIIQDELHLISGPLGTVVGLYESAIDLICSGADRPKILASTATIRRAENQVRSVFNRGAVQFPPPGLTPDDNYFARSAAPEEKGTRRYVGVMAPGTSHATLIVRTYAALLQAASELGAPDEVRDTYWSLIGYFNSLRVLASTYLQVLDDIPERIKVLANRSGEPPREISQEPVQLTSRIPQADIPDAMRSLEVAYPEDASPDVVLATNMISVGLDIDRLGLMVVAGQPQSASEYIQSTSRVGRRYPGLVVVVLNGQRSRDTSHYESFTSFHRSLYREVEASTATPFAARARDRGAHGLLVAAARLSVGRLRGDEDATAIVDSKADIATIVDYLERRARIVAAANREPDESTSFRFQLEQLVEDWVTAVSTDRVESYGKMKPARARKQDDRTLLRTADGAAMTPDIYPVAEPPWPTLTSMRDVDVETSLVEKIFPLKKEHSNGQ